jgi:hypothetical protein
VGGTARSALGRMLQEAGAAGNEAVATGAPIDEVSDLRSERRAEVRARAREAADAYNDAVRRVAEPGAAEDPAARCVAMENVKRVGRRDFLMGLNAGSEASMGVLRGYLVDLSEKGVDRTLRVEG